MEVAETVAAVRAWRSRQHPRAVGFVPTMGYLHEGHLALVRRARAENEVVAVSIFVNPTQFGPQEDYARYPRDLPRDLSLLEHEGVDLVFTPSVEEMYPPGFASFITVGPIGEQLEGAARPGHFRGVATVVAKLLNIVQPTRAYFGQKDAQQVLVIRRLVADLNFPVTIVPVATVRESDGLAMSSRNVYLSAEERAAAAAVPQALFAAEARYQAGERAAEVLRALVRERLAAVPGIQVEYVSVADAFTLDELDWIDRPALLSLAVRIGATRLIDNVLLGISVEDW